MYHRTRRASFLPRGALRSDAAPTVEYSRASPFAALSPEPSALSLRNGRVQDGLGVVRASALDSGAVRARGDGPSGWNAGRNCVLGAGGMERRPCGQTLRARRAALTFRRFTGSGDKAHAVGLLPRPQRL